MNSESGREARAPALLARRRVVCVRACVRARFGGLLEREDVQVVEVQRCGRGGSR